MSAPEEDYRPLDPFGFWPRRQSAVVERADTDGHDPGDYVFHTPYILQSPGVFDFRCTIEGLTDGEGELIVLINELPPTEGGPAVGIKSVVLPLSELAANGGRFNLPIIARAEHLYALVGSLTPNASARATRIDIEVCGESGALDYRQKLIDARQTIMRRPPLFEGLYKLMDGEPTLSDPVSQACTVSQFEEKAYDRWVKLLGRPLHRHRKQWEFVYILQALFHYGALRSGARGLGFGVGEEPLPALMASIGARITATDLPVDDTRASEWGGTGQHAASIAGISQPHIIPDATLAEYVDFMPVDMTAIPETLVDYDFTWSSCALEHVGSIALGLDFIERSVGCLKPGGIAVHTTEFNLLSNDKTIDHEGTVLFRRRDFEEITARLILQGHEVMPLNFSTGTTPMDDHIDIPPYSSNEHFKLLMSRYLTTSFGLIVRAAS